MMRPKQVSNPQTWTRLRRLDLRTLANEVGNEAVFHLVRWPSTGEGRRVKEITEEIAQLLGGQQSLGSLRIAFADLQRAAQMLKEIEHNIFFKGELAHKPITARRNDKRMMGDLLRYAIDEVEQYISNYKFPLPPDQTPEEELSDLVPKQKIGPAQFIVSNGVIKIHHSAAAAESRDVQNVESAREAILENGEWISENLTSSNADRRLISVLQEMQTRLRSQQDIIQLAVFNISCQQVFERFEQELPSAVSGRLQAYAVSLSMYVSQFPEWVRFSENAAQAEYTLADINTLKAAGEDLARSLFDVPEAIDPEVPRTLRWLLEAIGNPKRAAKRSVFAALRTIENLIALIFSTLGELLGGAKEGARKGIKLAVSGVVAVGLLTAAAKVATRLSPAATRIVQTQWLGKAANVVIANLEKE